MDYAELFKPYRLWYGLDLIDEADRDSHVEYVIENWREAFEIFQEHYNTDYGSIDIDENLISIHTGGWSDNEEIISEFKRTWWWTRCFKINKSGGHYFFDTGGEKEWTIIKKEK